MNHLYSHLCSTCKKKKEGADKIKPQIRANVTALILYSNHGSIKHVLFV